MTIKTQATPADQSSAAVATMARDLVHPRVTTTLIDRQGKVVTAEDGMSVTAPIQGTFTVEMRDETHRLLGHRMNQFLEPGDQVIFT